MAPQVRLGKDSNTAQSADSSLKREIVSEEGAEVPKKQRRKDKSALATMYDCYRRIESSLGVKPTETYADYLRVLEAKKILQDSDITTMVEDALAIGKARTLREMLTTRAIDIYRQENV